MMTRNLARMFALALCLLLPVFPSTVSAGGPSASLRALDDHAKVRQTLDQLIAAYEMKDVRGFSALVSERYVGEEASLDTALRRDFSARTNQTLRYTVNNLSLNEKGDLASLAVTFTRGWTDTRSGATRQETSSTTLLFIREGEFFRLYEQKPPRLFGLAP